MITIDLLVRYIPVPLSVEKKEESEAEAIYQKILQAMESGTPSIIELTCDKQTDKKIAVLSSQITGVIVSRKDGASKGSNVPGFAAILAEKS
ncbi:MAG: hypothetical protein NZ901_10650 [Geminocystis sp.]|nr:hypothetical protein [Geminocystis sp.]HIK38227.1 hypothetical protein [Geminocystis sp. M7585_C2015_104]MCS7148635.1 hypothetical protein [Geminocystis sp.]MCX8079567.1 hypothetical protein [Geminocystis sp.]MDW8115049.1 hypothetical protein [Geminocystis sp.]